MNVKRVCRLCRSLGLQRPKRRKTKGKSRHPGTAANSCQARPATRVNEVWTCDFIHDRTVSGGSLKWLSVVDEYTRELLLLQPAATMTAADVWCKRRLRTGYALRRSWCAFGAQERQWRHLHLPDRAGPPGRASVECLLSTPRWPRYDGAVEAGIGAMKDRTAGHAARTGHAGYWTWDGTAGAIMEANALSRPRGRAAQVRTSCGLSVLQSMRSSVRRSDAVSSKTWNRKSTRRALAMAQWTTYGQSARWLATPSASHSRSAGIFTTRGGEFSHRFPAEKRQTFRRGYTPCEASPTL